MCGICGYIHFNESERPSEAVLKGMTDTLSLRGPDDEGLYLKDNVALGHRRLSIIDLDTGHQPMSNEDGSLVIVYNGEIYNFQDLRKGLEEKGHAFRTHSDTEVIIHSYEEYGEDCLRRFNGMFAFALWDRGKKTLFLARDRFGKKPLYYCIFDNQFIFASELKSILEHPSVKREIDFDALSKYLAYEYVPSPYSIFKNINKLEAGTRLCLKGGKIGIERYWDLNFSQPASCDLKETKERLIGLFKESVRKRLVSDVPLGVFLSGGIDSSSVVCMMAALMNPKDIKTFSVGFGQRSFDESGDARLIAGHFGTDHHEEMLGPERMLEVLPRITDFLDEPFADSSIIPTYLVSNFTRRIVKVALGGDGGDELFLGYPSFIAHKLNAYLDNLPDPLSAMSISALRKIASFSNSYVSRFVRGLDFPQSIRHQVWIGAIIPAEQQKLLRHNPAADYDPLKVYEPTDRNFRKHANLNPMDRALYMYVKTYMTDDILTKVDRASMANSLEVRAPFLDTEFAEFAASIPYSYKIKGFGAKWILKDALKDMLPARTLAKPKHGFAVPIALWLRNELRGLLIEELGEEKIKKQGIFDSTYVGGLVRDFLVGRNEASREIWVLLMFQMWYDKWMR